MAYARHSSNNRRGRNNNRGGNRSNGANRRPQARLNQVHDSNGPEGRVRGTAAQIVEKYTSLARDAGASDNKVLQQSFLQHAEHYQRILSDIQKEIEQDNERRAEQKNDDQESNSSNHQKDNDDKMTDVPGFLNAEEEGDAKPKPGRKLKTEKASKKSEELETEPA